MFGKRGIAGALNRLLGRFGAELVNADEIWRPAKLLGRQPKPRAEVRASQQPPFLKVWAAPEDRHQKQFDFAVVIPSLLRDTLAAAIESVFSQDFIGHVQILVGVDVAMGDIAALDRVCARRPMGHEVMVFWPGYSTSARHGGIYPGWSGGATRTILTYLANSRYVAYLDDDNWWAPGHLSSLRAVLTGCEWAYSKRWFVHPRSKRPICIDEWESLGPNLGEFKHLGGFVDPTCLAIDKVACEPAIRMWCFPQPNSETGMDEDRRVFETLRRYYRGQGTGKATAFYRLDETDLMQRRRLLNMGVEAYARAGDQVVEAHGGMHAARVA